MEGRGYNIGRRGEARWEGESGGKGPDRKEEWSWPPPAIMTTLSPSCHSSPLQ